MKKISFFALKSYAVVPLEPTLRLYVRDRRQESTKKGGKILGRLHLPDRRVHLQTGHRVKDFYCTASRRSTATSPKPLTDKP